MSHHGKHTHMGNHIDTTGKRRSVAAARNQTPHEHIKHENEKPTTFKERAKACIHALDFRDNLIDPYITAELAPWKTVKAQTATYDDYAPDTTATWNETLELVFPHEPKVSKYKMKIQIFDEDVGADDLCGQAYVPQKKLEEIIAQPSTSFPFSLCLCDRAGEDCADVEVEITFVPNEQFQDLPYHGRWRKGCPSKGTFEVRVLSGSAIKNPDKAGAAQAAQSLQIKGTVVAFLYFGINATVYMLSSTKEVEGSDATENWTFGETLYFGIVTITTTGYGDLLPTNNFAKLYSCFNCFIGVILISTILGTIVASLMEKQAGALAGELQGKLDDVMATKRATVGSRLSRLCNAIPIPKHVCHAFGYVLLIKVLVVLYYTHADPHPIMICAAGAGDDDGCDQVHVSCNNKAEFEKGYDPNVMGTTFCDEDSGHMYYYYDFITALYMASVSMTSVGYGDFSPQSRGSRIFAIFWILLGWLTNGNAWGSLANWLLDSYQDHLDNKQKNKVFDEKSIMQIDTDKGGGVDEIEFVTHMLLKTGKVDRMTLADIRSKFSALDVGGDGLITKDELLALEEKNKAAEAAPVQVLPKKGS